MATKPVKSSSATESATESIFSRTLLAPIFFVSFLFSLLIIDRTTSATVFAHEKEIASTGSKDGRVGDQRYYHSHQKKLARREFEDAFAIRKRVLAGIVVAGAVGLLSAVWVGKTAWVWLARESDARI